MVLNYCDDQICLIPDNALIEEYVFKLKKPGYNLTLEPKGEMFGFLGIDLNQDDLTIELTQKGITDKTISYTGMSNASPQETPATQESMGSDKCGEPFNEEWNYSESRGMLLYL